MIRQGDAGNLEVLFPIKRCLDKCSAGQYTFIYIHYMCIYIHFSLQFVLLISGKSFFYVLKVASISETTLLSGNTNVFLFLLLLLFFLNRSRIR